MVIEIEDVAGIIEVFNALQFISNLMLLFVHLYLMKRKKCETGMILMCLYISHTICILVLLFWYKVLDLYHLLKPPNSYWYVYVIHRSSSSVVFINLRGKQILLVILCALTTHYFFLCSSSSSNFIKAE